MGVGVEREYSDEARASYGAGRREGEAKDHDEGLSDSVRVMWAQILTKIGRLECVIGNRANACGTRGTAITHPWGHHNHHPTSCLPLIPTFNLFFYY